MKKEREETGKVTTAVEGLLVIGIGNYDSVTKKMYNEIGNINQFKRQRQANATQTIG